jgi:hypothetical protein
VVFSVPRLQYMQPYDANKGLLNLRSDGPFQSLRRLSQAAHRRFASSLINQYLHCTPRKILSTRFAEPATDRYSLYTSTDVHLTRPNDSPDGKASRRTQLTSYATIYSTRARILSQKMMRSCVWRAQVATTSDHAERRNTQGCSEKKGTPA